MKTNNSVNKKGKKTKTLKKKSDDQKGETSVDDGKVEEIVAAVNNGDDIKNDSGLKKIEKKKAKKLAQKLKKAERKTLNQPDKNLTQTAKKVKSNVKPPKEQDATGDTKTEQSPKKKKDKKVKPTAEKDASGDTKPEASPKSAETTERILMKKEKKLKKRQLMKEQKLAEKGKVRDPKADEATVFVGNVPVNTKRVQLVRLFQKYGPIVSIRLRSAGGKILHKHKERRAAGSLNAYIVLKSPATVESALSLNGVEFKGNHLRVTKSVKDVTTQEITDEAKRTIFVGNLKYTTTEESLRETFTSCGEVEYVRCIRDGDKGCKGVAYVRFKTADAVGLALELNSTLLNERPINVERYSARKLGAKEQRDAQAVVNKNNTKKQIGKKNLDPSKKGKNANDKSKSGPKEFSKNANDASKNAKKSEFRGVKVEALKKKIKKKKSKNLARDLVKKIAPKQSK